MEIGTANYGSSARKNYFDCKDGDNIYRILPPMGTLAKKGIWNRYYRVEFGYFTSKGKMKPFVCPRKVNFKTKMVEVESAAYLKRAKLLEEKAKLETVIEKNPNHPQIAALNQKLADVTEAAKKFNSDAKVYVNAIDSNGRIGLLKLPKTAFDDLKKEIEALNAKGIDPLSSENGRMFVINRSGFSRDTKYKVTVYKETKVIEGEEVEKAVVHKLTPDIIARLAAEAFDLDSLYPTPTAEQVEKIVAGQPVDLVLDLAEAQATAAAAQDEENNDGEVENVDDLLASLNTETKVEAKAEAKPSTAELLKKADELPKKEEKKVEAKVETKSAAPAPTEYDDIDALLNSVM